MKTHLELAKLDKKLYQLDEKIEDLTEMGRYPYSIVLYRITIRSKP